MPAFLEEVCQCVIAHSAARITEAKQRMVLLFARSGCISHHSSVVHCGVLSATGSLLQVLEPVSRQQARPVPVAQYGVKKSYPLCSPSQRTGENKMPVTGGPK